MANHREECHHLLTREEETALGRLKPVIIHHLDLILETLILSLGSDPDAASLLQDAVAVDRLKLRQREYFLNLFDPSRQKRSAVSVKPGRDYQDPMGLGPRRHLCLLTQMVTALQPLIHEAFEDRPRLHRTIDQAMLNVVFHEIEALMAASVGQRDQWVEAAKRKEQEVQKTVDVLLSIQETEERRRLSAQLEMREELLLGHHHVCDVARKMNTPLNLILDSAEEILLRTDDPNIQRAVMKVVRQVEAVIALREPLRALGQEFLGKLTAFEAHDNAADATAFESRQHQRVSMPMKNSD